MAEQPFNVQAARVRQRSRASTMSGVHVGDKGGDNLNGTSARASLIGLGVAKDDIDFDNSEGGKLDIFRAFTVSFCIAFGAGIALVGWYPKLAGIWGFAFVIVVVSASGGIAENALHMTAIKTGASSFTELCVMLPTWMSRFTSISMILWGFTIAGLYVRYVFTFINDQFLDSRVCESGMASLSVYIPVGIAVYFITLPPKFSGPVVKVITNINLTITWVVIVTAIAKGIHMSQNTAVQDRPQKYEQWKPEGFLQVTVLLAGAMFQCSAVPRLQYEIIPAVKERAAVMIPLLLATVQGVIFLIVGLVGYYALGDNIDDTGDVFKAYRQVSPDWMVSILQGGIAMLMFLSLPLLGVPPKSELWALLQLSKNDEDKVPFENTSVMTRLLMNLVMVTYATLLAPTLGPVGVTTLVTILAGSAANWLNLFLPSFVNLYATVFPAREQGEPYAASAVKSAWILLIAILSLGSSAVKVYKVFFPDEDEEPAVPKNCGGLF